MANLEFVILLDIRQSAPLLLSQALVLSLQSADCFMTFLLWLIATHIQELEEELKLLKNHSQPNIVVSNKSFLSGKKYWMLLARKLEHWPQLREPRA
uniref:Uncharacterized protein n=1 Tax=Brassica oleracea TaxID=3712 RepID=A0A3P6FCZ5_BRAOL|nr:unnamed protein product [Brassica oleracea]